MHATIVTTHEDTLDELDAYLRRAGITTSTARGIEGLARAATGAAVMVLFPDDFDWDAVVDALRECRRRNAQLLAVLVTKSPRRFEGLVLRGGGPGPLVVAKPAWGWAILDAIRGHLRAHSGPRSTERR